MPAEPPQSSSTSSRREEEEEAVYEQDVHVGQEIVPVSMPIMITRDMKRTLVEDLVSELSMSDGRCGTTHSLPPSPPCRWLAGGVHGG